MSILTALKTANVSRSDADSPTQRRRGKLVEKLEEQLQGSDALFIISQAGTSILEYEIVGIESPQPIIKPVIFWVGGFLLFGGWFGT